MNTHTCRIQTLCLLLFFLSPYFAVAQNDVYKNLDFGRFYLSLPPGNVSLKFYSTPSKDKSPAWELDFGSFATWYNSAVVKGWLTKLKDRTSQDASTRMIEVERVDEYALAILSFTPDSLWAQVSLDCRILQNPPVAWLYLYDANAVGAKVKSWTNFFLVDQAVVFTSESGRAFYADATARNPVFPTLAGDSSNPDYSMRVIRTSGPWMEVYLYSPSDFPSMDDPKEVRAKSKNPPPRFWIRYLDERGRPRIWYLWD